MHHRHAWVALVACRKHALPVAWHVVAAQARGSRMAHFKRRWCRPGCRCTSCATQGLGSRELWRQIVNLGRHPVLRHPLPITFRPTGGGPDTLRVETGAPPCPAPWWCRMPGAHKEPWLLPADTLPKHTDAAPCACRHWIGQGFRGCERGGWQW
ncbi:MAG: hypothetical protein J4G06_01965 [Caldilineaceae bacterium]|nr:hypothetical protein [Caldilineaceae bacterium]